MLATPPHQFSVRLFLQSGKRVLDMIKALSWINLPFPRMTYSVQLYEFLSGR